MTDELYDLMKRVHQIHPEEVNKLYDLLVRYKITLEQFEAKLRRLLEA